MSRGDLENTQNYIHPTDNEGRGKESKIIGSRLPQTECRLRLGLCCFSKSPALCLVSDPGYLPDPDGKNSHSLGVEICGF